MMRKLYNFNYQLKCLNVILIVILYLRVSITETRDLKNIRGNPRAEHRIQISRRSSLFWNPSNFFSLFDIFQQTGAKPLKGSEELLQIDENLQEIDSLDDVIELPDDLSLVNSSFREDPDGVLEEKEEDEEESEFDDDDETLVIRGNKTLFKAPPSHIILVPGLGGSRLEARWKKKSVSRYICDKYSDWVDIWVNLRLLLPYVVDCFLDNFRLEFDHATNTTHEPKGVEVRVKRPSKVAHIEDLVDFGPVGKDYYKSVVKRLLPGKSGFDYKRDVSILGAPYDFRRAPNELKDYFDNLKITSEENFHKNGLKPVTFICHSMGCSLMLYFLQRQAQEWKDKYIKRLITIGAPWGGSMVAIKSVTVGYSLGVPLPISDSKLADLERTLPSTMFLFPHKQVFKDSPLIISYSNPAKTIDSEKELLEPGDGINLLTTNELENYKNSTSRSHDDRIDFSDNYQKQSYTLDNMKQFFEKINYTDGYKMWLQTKDLLGSLEPPNVEVWCIVGRGYKTLVRLDYLGKFPHSHLVDVYDDGDGTVSLKSARYCENWVTKQDQPVHYKELISSHIEILKNETLLDLILEIINEKTDWRW